MAESDASDIRDPSDDLLQPFRNLGLEQLETVRALSRQRAGVQLPLHHTVHHETIVKEDVVQSPNTEVNNSEIEILLAPIGDCSLQGHSQSQVLAELLVQDLPWTDGEEQGAGGDLGLQTDEITEIPGAKPQMEDVEKASRYENETTSTRNSDDKSSDIINKSAVPAKKEDPELFTNSSGTSVGRNTTHSSVTDVEPQLTEEASQHENALGTTSTMAVYVKDLKLNNSETKVSERKKVVDVITAGRELAEPTAANDSVVQPRNNELINRLENKKTLDEKNTANSTDKKPPATADKSDLSEEYFKEQIYGFLFLTKDKSNLSKALRMFENTLPTSLAQNITSTSGKISNRLGNAELAPNPSVAEDSGFGSFEGNSGFRSSDGDPQQSNICSAGYTIQRQDDEKTTEFQSISHEEDRQIYYDQESEQSNTDEASNSLCGTVEYDDRKIIDMFKDMNFQTKISDTRVTDADVIHNVKTDKKFIPKKIGKKSEINLTYMLNNDNIIMNRNKNITKRSIVECDSKETMARVKELKEKMINRQLEELEELEFRLCHLKKEHLEEFLWNEELKPVVCKISKLSIGYTKNVSDLIPAYCRIASDYKSTKLSLVFNDLKNEDIKVLLENLDENEDYEEIDMSYNRNIGPAGYGDIGKMVEKHRVRVVRLADCDISDVDLHKLFDGMGDAKLEVLDISCTNNVTAEGFAHIGKQVAQKRIKKLKLSDTQLNVETLTAFYKEVAGSIEDSESQQVLVEEIDVSYNSAMEPEAYKVLGSMVKLFGVKKLSLAGCGLKKEHLQDFREKIKSENTGQYTKMKSLNAGDNTSIGKGIVEIAKIVNECQLEELDISECRFSANELKDFVSALDEAKTFTFCSSNSAQLKILYLGEERQFDKNYISQVCNLLPHIAKMLCLKGAVRNNFRKMLQDKLNRLGESKLEIKLDDDMTLRSQIEDEVLLLNSS